MYHDLYHPRTYASIRDWDHPGLCKTRSGRRLPVRQAINDSRTIFEARLTLFEIVRRLFYHHSDIQSPTISSRIT